MAYNFNKRYYMITADGRKVPISSMDKHLLMMKAAGARVSAANTMNPYVQQVLSGGGRRGGGSYMRSTRTIRRSTPSRSSTAARAKTSWKKAYEQAKAANKAREQEIRAGYKKRYAAVMSGLSRLGEADRQRILQRGERQKGEAEQSAIARGLAGGTVVDSLKQSVQEGVEQSMNQLDEAIRRTKLGYEDRLRKEELDFIERITDKYPDQRLYANMFQQHGQGTAGVGSSLGSSLISGTGLFGNTMNIGHSFYAGRDRYGRTVTSKTPVSSTYYRHHQFSSPRTYSRRSSNYGRSNRRSMSSKMRTAYNSWQSRKRQQAATAPMPKLNYTPTTFGPTRVAGTYSSAMPEYLKQRYGFA